MTSDTVLIVDRDPVFLRVMERALEAGGYVVKTATTAKEACKTAVDAVISVAVITLEEDCPAEELIEFFYETECRTECILLTPSADFEVTTLVRLYDAGNVYNHLAKPLEDIGDFVRDISRAIERRALKRQSAYLLTELRDTRDELRHLTEFLVQVEKKAAVGELFASVAKEIAGPLERVAAAADGIQETVAGKQRLGAVACAQVTEGAAAIRRVARTCVAALAGLTRFEVDGTEETTGKTVDLNEVVEETADLLAGSIRAQNIDLEMVLSPEMRVVDGNTSQIRHAVMHVVLNALRALPTGGKLTLRTDYLPEKSGGAIVEIRDSGPGIPADVLPRIFEPFFTTERLGHATGLGLAASRSIIRENDGQVEVTSTVGVGTTVRISLPARVAADPPVVANLIAA